MVWCQEGPGRGVLFLLAKMSQDPVDDVLILNARHDRNDRGILSA
tara:strand:- start:578 stop:712 length:135 start_codon:yes stop_codon:yes gene_type:complete